MRWIRRRLSYANIVASIALFLALGGGAYAIAGNRFVGPNGVVKMCIQSANHVPLVASPGVACPAGSTPLALSQRGKRGPRGARGPKGKTGPAATTPSFMDANNQLAPPACGGGCLFTFQRETGDAGVENTTSDIHLGNDNSTFVVANAGTYLVTVVVVPATLVRLEVNGSGVGPNTPSCTTVVALAPPPQSVPPPAPGTYLCTFQRILNLLPSSTIRLVNTTSDREWDAAGSGITILRIG
jgi:hypothetical protein